MALIGTYLKHLRKTRGLTCVVAADHLGVTNSYVSMIETNKRIPHVDYLRKASIFYKADFHVLVAQTIYTDLLQKIEMYNSPLDLTLNQISKCIQEKNRSALSDNKNNS